MAGENEIPGANTLKGILEGAAATNADEAPEGEAEGAQDEGAEESAEASAQLAASEEEYTDEEQAAIAQGWNPDYDGPNRRSAREFLDRGELLGKISERNKQLKQLQDKVDFLLKRDQAARKTGLEGHVKSLTDKKKEAIIDRDADAIIELDEQLAAARADLAAAAAEELDEAVEDTTEETHTPPPQIEAWVQQNTWYSEDNEMRQIADTIGGSMLESQKQMLASGKLKKIDGAEILAHVEKRIKELYPRSKYFAKTARVEGAKGRRTSQGRRGSGHTVRDLDAQERQVLDNMLRLGSVKSEEEYIANLESIGYFDQAR